MAKLITKKNLFTAVMCFLNCSYFLFSAQGKDHGRLEKNHVQVAKNFLEKNFFEEKKLSKEKIEHFLSKLIHERDILKKDIYETTILEKLELDVKKYTKAKNKAEEKSDIKNATSLRGYEEYLIPKIRKLLELVETDASKNEKESILDDFIRGYNPYYVPNAHRNIWPKDLDFFHNVKRMLVSYKFKEKTNKVEAFNLLVSAEQLENIQSCIHSDIKTGDYLNQDEITKLKTCRYDISKINPGISTLWKETNTDTIEYIHKQRPGHFPQDDKKLYYSRIIYRGHQSPKIKIFYLEKGQKTTLKLKLGQEIHADIATSRILELAGFNQDKMIYKEKVKIFLGKTSYDEFKSDFVNKYGLERFIRYISDHGSSPDGEWVTFEEALFETRQNKELRVGPFDISSWDLSNRREFRALLLVWGWLGITNSKLANFKFLFREDDTGLTPLMRFQDPSSSLGSGYHLKKIKNILSFNQFSRVNAFPSSFIKKNKNKISIEWNDMSQFKRYFSFTTWNDLKWMARKIADISENDIYQVLHDSGMPKPVCDLYYIKIINRRNEIVNAFELQNEYPNIQVSDLKNYTIHNERGETVIEKGKLKQVSFPGKNVLYHVPEKYSTMIPRLLAFDIPVANWKNSNNQQNFETSITGLNGLKSEIDIGDSESPKAITTFPLGIGIQAIVSRIVQPNSQYLNNNNTMRIYMIRDKLKIRFSLDSPFLRKQIKKIKALNVDARIRFFEYEFEYIHYSDHVKKAYLSKFNLPYIIAKTKKYATLQTKPLEIIKIYQKYGIDLDAEVGAYSLKPVVKNEASITGGINKILLKTFVRDQYGQLHIYSEKTQKKHIGAGLNILEMSPLGSSLPLFKIIAGKNKFKHTATDNVYYLEENTKNKNEPSEQKRKSEFYGLKKLKKSPQTNFILDPDLNKFRTNFKIESYGAHSVKEFGAGFIFNHKKISSTAHSQITLPNGKKRSFFRQMYSISKSKGISSGLLSTGNMLLSNRQKTVSVLEMDQDRPQKTTIIVRAEQYFKKRNRSEIIDIINSLNKKFSKDDTTPFYTDYVLPQDDDVDKYKKVYALTRIFINGEEFFKKIITFNKEHNNSTVLKHFNNSHRKTKKFLKLIDKAKLIANEYKNENKHIRLSEVYTKIVKKLNINQYGLYFLNEFLSVKGLFVMGEIQGVFPSFSSLQDLQQNQRKRFMGTSWGTYNTPPPLQKFLRKRRLITPSIHIEKNVSDHYIFGDLESCLAPNIEFLYHHQTKF